MARRSMIGAFCVLALTAAACGRSSDSSSDTTAAPASTAAPQTTAAAGGAETTAGGEGATTAAPETTVADPCAGAALEATEVGVSESKITVTVMADVGSPLAPGLFQGHIDAMNAFAEYVNANGGIGCRQLEVRTWDSKLDATESKNGLIDACQNSVALVGGNALTNPDMSPVTGCVDKAGAATGLPNLAGLANDLNEQCNATTFMISARAEPCTTFEGPRDIKVMVGPMKWYVDNLGPDLHGIFMVPGDRQTTVLSSTFNIAGQENVGIKWDPKIKVSGFDPQAAFTPRIAAAAAAGSTYIYNGSNDKAMWNMRKEAKAQGLTSVKVWACSLSCYTKAFLETGGADVEGTYMFMQFLPFEEADANAELKAYLDAVGIDKADSFGTLGWQAGVAFKQAVDGIVAENGPNAITRQAILDALGAMTDFDANGWLAPKSLQGFGTCFVLVQVKDGAFVRVHPEKPGTFDCEPSNIATINLDPAVASESIT